MGQSKQMAVNKWTDIRSGKKWCHNLLFAGPDQKDDEDREHYGSQSHDNEWKVGHQRDDHQQLMNFRRRCIVNHHTLLKTMQGRANCIMLSLKRLSVKQSLFLNVSYLIDEHDGEDSFVQASCFAVLDTVSRVSSNHVHWQTHMDQVDYTIMVFSSWFGCRHLRESRDSADQDVHLRSLTRTHDHSSSLEHIKRHKINNVKRCILASEQTIKLDF